MVIGEVRRRIGKTRFLGKWIQKHQEIPILYWKPENSTREILLRQFSKAIYKFSHQGQTINGNFNYSTWETTFQQLSGCQSERFTDIPLLKLAKSQAYQGSSNRYGPVQFPGQNRRMYFSGHQAGLMYQEELINPEFHKINLTPLPYTLINNTILQYTPEENLVLFSVFGGIPFYLSQINPQISVA